MIPAHVYEAQETKKWNNEKLDSVWYWKDIFLSFSSFLFFVSLAASLQIQIWDLMILFIMQK